MFSDWRNDVIFWASVQIPSGDSPQIPLGELTVLSQTPGPIANKLGVIYAMFCVRRNDSGIILHKKLVQTENINNAFLLWFANCINAKYKTVSVHRPNSPSLATSS